MRKEKRNSDLRTIAPAVNQVIKALWAINGFSGPAPLFAFPDVAPLDRERADRDAVLAEAGICSFTEEYLLRVYDYQPGDVVIPQQQAIQAPAAVQAPFAARVDRRFAAAGDDPEEQSINALAAAADPVLTGWVDELKGRVDQARDLEELRDAILDVYPDMDTAALAEVMMQQQMIARCIGMLEVKSELTGVGGVNELAVRQPVALNVKQEPSVFNVTLPEQPPPVVNVTIQQAAQEPPTVNNIIPEQAAPVVHVQSAVPDAHFAPNGFGCKCKIYRATGDEYQSAPNKGKRPDNVPPDKGFAYNPGKAWRGDRPDDKGDTWEPLPYHKSQNGKPLPIDKTYPITGYLWLSDP